MSIFNTDHDEAVKESMAGLAAQIPNMMRYDGPKVASDNFFSIVEVNGCGLRYTEFQTEYEFRGSNLLSITLCPSKANNGKTHCLFADMNALTHDLLRVELMAKIEISGDYDYVILYFPPYLDQQAKLYYWVMDGTTTLQTIWMHSSDIGDAPNLSEVLRDISSQP